MMAREGSVYFRDNVGKTIRSVLTLRHGEIAYRRGKRIIMEDVDKVSDGWDLLQVDGNLIAIDKRDPMVLAILYSQNILDRFGNI